MLFASNAPEFSEIEGIDLSFLRSTWPSWDSLSSTLLELLSLKMPDMYRVNIRVPNVKWKWFMKLKIFIGFSQCFCYFPVVFNVQWPENLLKWMKWLEFTSIDIYAVFGDVSCRFQTGFLQKFVFHLALFPVLLGAIGAAYVLTKVLPSGKYTAESARTQSFTLILFIAFTLYTGVSTRIFRLFKCQKIEETWYLTADYTVKCRTEVECVRCHCWGLHYCVRYWFARPQLYILLKNRSTCTAKAARIHKHSGAWRKNSALSIPITSHMLSILTWLICCAG